jgi:hypothetical protein
MRVHHVEKRRSGPIGIGFAEEIRDLRRILVPAIVRGLLASSS